MFTTMPFPELIDRFFRLFNIKNPNEAAPPIDLDRTLTSEEKSLIEWLLRNAEPGATEFLPQLEAAQVYIQCGCGCPTIGIRIPESIPSAESRRNLLADFLGTVDDQMVGVILHQAGGRLCELEVYALADPPNPFGLPSPSTLYRFEDQSKHSNHS